MLTIFGTGAGIPSEMSDGIPWSTAANFVLLFVYVFAFAIAVGLIVWFDRKLSSRRLFRDIYRELGIGGRPPR